MKSKNSWNLIFASNAFKYVVVILIIIVFCVLFCLSDILYGEDNPEAKGKVLATCLSIIGGACVK